MNRGIVLACALARLLAVCGVLRACARDAAAGARRQWKAGD